MTQPRARLPDFLIVGAMKAGTTSLVVLLRRHPELSLPVSESYFFSQSAQFGKGSEWYARQFQAYCSAKILGEKCASYGYIAAAAPRIAQVLPHARLVWILRNPIERTYSNYLHNLRNGTETLTFKAALKRELDGHTQNPYRCYLARSCYASEIQRYLQLFQSAQIFVFLLEELNRASVSELNKLFRFLGVSTDTYEFKPVHANVYRESRFPRLLATAAQTFGYGRPLHRFMQQLLTKPGRRPRIRPETMALLLDYFKKPNQQLAALTGIDLSLWGERNFI